MRCVFGLLAVLLGLMPKAIHAQPGPDPRSAGDPPAIAAPASEKPDSAALSSFVDGLAAVALGTGDVAGLHIVVIKDGRSLIRAYGLADVETGRPLTPDTLMRIGSISKTFVWLSVMILAQEGRLDLDADINTYLEGIEIPETFSEPVTLTDIMAHRSGFEDSFGVYLDGPSGRSLTEALRVHQPARVYPPGVVTSYGNWPTALASKIVEDVSGLSVHDFIETRILVPLGMDATSTAEPTADNEAGAMDPALFARLARGHAKKGGVLTPLPPTHIGAMRAAGGMSLPAGDMARYMAALLADTAHEGGQLLAPDWAARLRSRAFDDRPHGDDMAHGFFDGAVDGVRSFGHNGATAGFLAVMSTLPDFDAAFYVATNTRGSDSVIAIADALRRHLAGQPPRPAPRDRLPVSNALRAQADGAAGTYVTNRRSFTRLEKLMGAGAAWTVTATGDGALKASGSGRTRLLVPVADGTYEDSEGRRYVLHYAADGSVARLALPGGSQTLERVGFLEAPATLALGLAAASLFSVTILIGLWRRLGRPGTPGTGVGKVIGGLNIVTALAWLAFLGTLISMALVMAGADPADPETFAIYPPPIAVMAMGLAGAAVILAGLTLLSVPPAWTYSGWGVTRKLHHSLFALALGGAAALLVIWNLAFAATAVGP